MNCNHHHDLSNYQNITNKIHECTCDTSEIWSNEYYSPKRNNGKYWVKLVRLETHHVITATILFDEWIAFGATFCVFGEIFNCLVIIILLPTFNQMTWNRIMWFVTTAETKIVTTTARTILSIGQQMISFYGQITTRWWTPTQWMIVLLIKIIKKWVNNLCVWWLNQ